MKNCLHSALILLLLTTARIASAQLTLSFSIVPPSCQGFTNGSATALPDGGAQPYTFLWNNGQTSAAIIGVGAGNYTVTVTDNNGQTVSGTAQVTDPAPFVAGITANGLNCAGTAGTLTANGSGNATPFSYQWSTQESSPTISVAGPGNYFVTVTNANGCADVADYTVANALSVQVTGTNIPCATDPNGGAVSASVSGGVPPYAAIWADGSTEFSRQNLPAGAYYVTVSDARNCTASGQATITMPPPLEVTVIAINPSCNGANNGGATILATGGTPPYTHTWTPGGYTGSTVMGLAPGTYYVCTFDANHCQKDLWVTIPEITGLNVTLSVVSAECTGQDNGVVTALVDPPGNYWYQWNVPPFTGVTQLTGLAAGTFVAVTVTDPTSGCSGTATATVGTHHAINIQVVDTDVQCAGQNLGSATATASGGTPEYTYLWLIPPAGPEIGGGPTITGLAPGAYMVSVTDARGCTAISVADIGLISDPHAAIGGLTTVLCGEDSSKVQFNNLSTDPLGSISDWKWILTLSTGQVLEYTHVDPLVLDLPVGATGTATLVAISANNCSDTAAVQFTVPGIPDISLSTGAIGMDCDNNPVYIKVLGGQPGYSYQWSPMTDLTLDPTPPNATADPDETTTYQLVTSNLGCVDTVSVKVVRIDPIQLSVGPDVVNTCDGSTVLTAVSNVADVKWVDALGNVLGNPATVSTGPTAVYSAIATDSMGCADTLTVSVTGWPVVDLSAQAELADCDNGPVHIQVTGGTPDLTYTWTPSNDLTPDVVAPNVIADPDVTTTYQLVGANPGCSDTVSVKVVRIDPIQLSVGPDVVNTCEGSTVLTAVSNVSDVKWVDALGNVLGNPATVNAGPTAVYTAIATDTMGCSDTLTVSVTGWPVIALSAEAELFNCENDPVHIVVTGGTPDLTYTWSPNTDLTPDTVVPNVIADPATTTTYQLIGSNPGCSDTLNVKVVRVDPIGLSVVDKTIETCDSVAVLLATTQVNAEVVWIDSNGNVLGNPPTNPVTVDAGPTMSYTAIATDAYGCVDSLSVTVTGFGVDVSIDPDMPGTGCAGSEIQLGLINNQPGTTLQYIWSVSPPMVIDNPAASNPIVSGPVGNYQVSVTVSSVDNFECIQTLVIPIEIKPMDTLDAEVSADLCDGKTVKFHNNSGISGLWDFGDNNGSELDHPIHTYQSAGSYHVTFTPNLAICLMPWDSMIKVMDAPLEIPEITHDYVKCITQAEINFHGSSNNPDVTWAWTFSHGTPSQSNEQNPIVTFTEEDTITAILVITDVNGCRDSMALENVAVEFIDDHIEEALMFCQDTTIALNADGIDSTATYQWISDPEDVNLDKTSKNPVVSPKVTTVYTVTISQGPNCSATYAVTVTPLDSAFLNLPKDTFLCVNQPISITVTGNGLNYQWSESANFNPILATGATVSLAPKKDGVYYVRTATDKGCLALDSIKVGDGLLDVEIEPWDAQICLGEEVTFQINNLDPDDQLTFDWTPDLPNSGGQTVSPTENTTYHVVVSNQHHCTAEQDLAVNVSYVGVEAGIVGKDTICPGMSAQLLATTNGTDAPYTYLWSPANSLSNPTIADPVATPTEQQDYVVTVTNAQGCTSTDDVTVYFIDGQCIEPYIFVPKAFTPNNDANNDFFIVRGVNITELLFIVWDRWGEKVYETTDPAATGWDGTFNGKELTPDSYAWYLRARCGNGAVYENKGDVTLLK